MKQKIQTIGGVDIIGRRDGVKIGNKYRYKSWSLVQTLHFRVELRTEWRECVVPKKPVLL